MKSKLFFLLMVTLVAIGPIFAANPALTAMDKAILKSKLTKFAADRSIPIGDLVLKIGMDFLNTPYVGKTLDKSKEESLVVNLHQLDCTTFAENCLALARTIKNEKPTVETFCSELEGIRYRGGKLNGYASRLHYFCEWISDNEERHHVKAVAAQLGGPILPIRLNFMSNHPQEYPQLINDPETTSLIKSVEERVSAQKYYYIPVNQVESIEKGIMDGDIVTLTTSIPGIDVSHVGILFNKEGRIYMLHASSTIQKVTITTEPFALYLAKGKKTTGIMIARPVE